MSAAAHELAVTTTASPVRVILKAINFLTVVDGWMGVGCLASLILLMLAEVVVRAASNVLPWLPADIPVAWEYCSYLMAACFTFGAAMTLRTGGHIQVTLLLDNVHGTMRRILQAIVSFLGLLSVGFLAYAMGRFSWTSYVGGQTSMASGTLLWIPQCLVTFGIVLLALQLLARTLEAACGLPTEDAAMKAFGSEH
jgi:TRAP-type C4-dicarboxylate transport system permease small subunit